MKLLTGVVEDLDDPLKIGRVKVRIHVEHCDSKTPNVQAGVGITTEHLPWCQPIQSISSSAMNGVGISPTGLEIGSWVVLSSINANKDVYFIVGSIAAIDDVHESVTGEENEVTKSKSSTYKPKSSTFKDEPASPYKPVYPNNKSIHTKSGHLIEIDDTKGAERISIFHKSGTFVEFHNEGVLVEKVIGNKYSISLEDNNVYAKGNINIISESDVNIKSDNSNINVEAAADVKVTAKNITATAENISIDGSSSVDVKGNSVVVKADGNCKVSGSSLNLESDGNINIDSGGAVSIFAGSKIRLSGKKVVNI